MDRLQYIREAEVYMHFVSASHRNLVDLIAIARSEFLDCPLGGRIFGAILYIDQYGGNKENWNKLISPVLNDLKDRIKKHKPLYPEKFEAYQKHLLDLTANEFVGVVRGLAIDIKVEYPKLVELHQNLNLQLNEGNE